MCTCDLCAQINAKCRAAFAHSTFKQSARRFIIVSTFCHTELVWLDVFVARWIFVFSFSFSKKWLKQQIENQKKRKENLSKPKRIEMKANANSIDIHEDLYASCISHRFEKEKAKQKKQVDVELYRTGCCCCYTAASIQSLSLCDAGPILHRYHGAYT